MEEKDKREKKRRLKGEGKSPMELNREAMCGGILGRDIGFAWERPNGILGEIRFGN